MVRSFARLRSLGVALTLAGSASAALAQPKPLAPAPPKAPSAPATPSPAPAAREDVPLGVAGPTSEPSAADLAKARAIFDAGGRAYDAGNYDAALQAFEQAYAIAGRDNIVFSIAQAHRQAFVLTQDEGHLGKAITAYKQFIASGKAGARKGEAVKALGELQAIQATHAPTASRESPATALPAMKTMLAIDSPTPGAMISIDDSPPAPPQVDADVTPGPHRVKLTAPGYVDKEVTVRVDKGEYHPATFELEEKPGQVVVTTQDGAEVSIDGRFVGKAPLARAIDVPPGKRFVSVTLGGHQSRSEVVMLEHGEEKKLAFKLPTTVQRDASYAFFGAAGAALVATATLGAFAYAKQQEALSINRMAQITLAQRDTYDADVTLRDQLRGSAVAAGVGTGLLALVGSALFVFDRPGAAAMPSDTAPPRPKEERPKTAPPRIEMRIDPWFSPTAGGVGAVGVF